MIKRIFCLISVFIIILSCSCLNVYASTEEIYIVNMTDEEIEEYQSIQMFGTTNEVKIAKWLKCIDNTQSELSGHSVQYYYPVYNGVEYKNFKVVYARTSSAVSSWKYRILYYSDETNFTSFPAFNTGNVIEVLTGNLDTVEEYLYDNDCDRTAISATLRCSEGSTYSSWFYGTFTNHYNNTDQADTYSIWYKEKHSTNPPLLSEDGTCEVHSYLSIALSATCTEKAKIKYSCIQCGYYYDEINENSEPLGHTYEDGVCTVCGEEEPNENDGILARVGEWFQNLIDTIMNGFTDLVNWVKGIAENFKSYIDEQAQWNTIPEDGTATEQFEAAFGNIEKIIGVKLQGNGFYDSVVVIKNELESLYEADYSDPNGFYELGLTDITLRKPTVYIKKDYGNEVIGDWEQVYVEETSKIDYGLNNAQLLNLDWFFGRNLGNGYYTTGVKEYSDAIIGSFLWLLFGWWIWHNLPDLINGEIGATTNFYNRFSSDKEREHQEATRQAERANREAEKATKEELRQKEKEYRNSYEAYKERQDRNREYKARYNKERSDKK